MFVDLIKVSVFQDQQLLSNRSLKKTKKEFAANMASSESVQSELRYRNDEITKELGVSQHHVLNLSSAMTQLGKITETTLGLCSTHYLD